MNHPAAPGDRSWSPTRSSLPGGELRSNAKRLWPGWAGNPGTDRHRRSLHAALCPNSPEIGSRFRPAIRSDQERRDCCGFIRCARRPLCSWRPHWSRFANILPRLNSCATTSVWPKPPGWRDSPRFKWRGPVLPAVRLPGARSRPAGLYSISRARFRAGRVAPTRRRLPGSCARCGSPGTGRRKRAART